MSDNQPDAPNQDNEPSQPTKRSSADNDTSTQPSDVAPTVKADDTAISDDLDPAERDARWLRRWYPVSFVGKLALLVVSLLLAILLAIYYAVGTPWGTNLLVKAIVQQTGISLKYGEGNLRDGLWIYDLNIPSKPPTNYVEISVDKAYVKIGWRAILAKEVHLREATIGNMTIT